MNTVSFSRAALSTVITTTVWLATTVGTGSAETGPQLLGYGGPTMYWFANFLAVVVFEKHEISQQVLFHNF